MLYLGIGLAVAVFYLEWQISRAREATHASMEELAQHVTSATQSVHQALSNLQVDLGGMRRCPDCESRHSGAKASE